MLTVLLTFTQKVTALAPLLNDGTIMKNCSMLEMANSSDSEVNEKDCSGENMSPMNCENDCEMMTVVSVLHFIEHDHSITQHPLLMTYQKGAAATPSYFPESLYRPPFLN